MTRRELEEYRALRATIRERGTTRHWVVIAGFGLWAALGLGVAASSTAPFLTLLPLVVLSASFEVVFALHTGVERVGRYLQVFFESPGESARWEHLAMTHGAAFVGTGVDALFSPCYLAAVAINLLPALGWRPIAIDSALVALAHAALGVRIWSARRRASTQRARDLAQFQRIKTLEQPPTPGAD